jgi:hypothetical protein
MAKLRATGLAVAGPVGPVAPEPPERATGLLSAFDQELPVWPLFVALDWAVAAPDPPVVEVGLELTDTVPPAPPSELPTATLEPPTAVTAPDGASTTLTAGAPGRRVRPVRRPRRRPPRSG